jgi:hypothetical protein
VIELEIIEAWYKPHKKMLVRAVYPANDCLTYRHPADPDITVLRPLSSFVEARYREVPDEPAVEL